MKPSVQPSLWILLSMQTQLQHAQIVIAPRSVEYILEDIFPSSLYSETRQNTHAHTCARTHIHTTFNSRLEALCGDNYIELETTYNNVCLENSVIR